MSHILLGLFHDSTQAGAAVGQLKEKGYTKEISVLAYDPDYEDSHIHEIKQDVSTGTGLGATLGAVTGVLAGLFSGISALFVPGIGILVGGPLAALLGVTGGVVGSMTGGLLGALVDLGINESTAQLFEERIRAGEVMVGVTTGEDNSSEVSQLLQQHGATDITTIYQ